MTFIANVQNDDDNMTPFGTSNQFSMFDITNQCLIHPLYDIKDMCLKSNIKKITDGHQEKDNTEKFVDIYSPQISSNPIHVTKMGEYAYAVSDNTKDGPIYLRTNLDDKRKTTPAEEVDNTKYNYKLKSGHLKTYLYGEDRSQELSTNFQRKQNLDGVEYNYIYEIPLNSQDYNDFENGDIQTEIFQAKSTYDSLYSMNMPESDYLSCTRQYCGVGQCGDELYFKYYDNVDYEFGQRRHDDNNDIETIDVKRIQRKYSYQKLETIRSINRFKSNIRHKSNVYSISIRNTGLNTDYIDKGINDKVAKLKTDIKNNIREIAKQICPVNTQLFDVYFDGV